MHWLSRRGLAAAVAGLVVAAGTGVAYASYLTPDTNPFNVPGDLSGIPQSFEVQVSGFAPGTPVFLEQCDGRDPSTGPQWSPSADCDPGTSPSQVTADASGIADFPAGDANFGFIPVKGLTPSRGWYCLAPHATPPNDGKAVYGQNPTDRCLLRASSNNASATTDQSFLKLILPDDPNDLTTTTTTTTTAPPQNPSCTVDGSTLKKGSSIKISKGLLPAGTPAAKFTKLTIAGDMTNCQTFDNVNTKLKR